MNRSLSGIALLLALALPASTAETATLLYRGTFSGANENPPVPSAGTGLAEVSYDDVAHMLGISVSFSGLTGPTTAAHIHVASVPGGNGGVATQVPSFVGFPLGVTAGSYAQTFDLTQSSSWNPAFITDNGGTTAGAEAALANALAGGLAYFNVHTSFAPGGEIRANLAIPELSTWMAMIVGFGVMGVALRRRRVSARFAV